MYFLQVFLLTRQNSATSRREQCWCTTSYSIYIIILTWSRPFHARALKGQRPNCSRRNRPTPYSPDLFFESFPHKYAVREATSIRAVVSQSYCRLWRTPNSRNHRRDLHDSLWYSRRRPVTNKMTIWSVWARIIPVVVVTAISSKFAPVLPSWWTHISMIWLLFHISNNSASRSINGTEGLPGFSLNSSVNSSSFFLRWRSAKPASSAAACALIWSTFGLAIPQLNCSTQRSFFRLMACGDACKAAAECASCIQNARSSALWRVTMDVFVWLEFKTPCSKQLF